MSILNDKADFGARIYEDLARLASLDGQEADGMRLLQLYAGIMLETLLLFDTPEDGLPATYKTLSGWLGCKPFVGEVSVNAMPPSYVLDYETENGRKLAKCLFVDWLDCAYEFHDLVTAMVHHLILRLEAEGQPRGEVFRIFIECLNRAMAYEVAAQELCDIVIDEKMGVEGWTLCEAVSGLSAVAGRMLALSHNACEIFSAPSLPEKLEQISFVMTQEAVRLDVPQDTDWRCGLAANDYIVQAPLGLINGLEPRCRELFALINLHDFLDCAVACAKAAGRMIAVASSGEQPEVEPVITKPLAITAMTDTYRSVCGHQVAV